MSVEFTLTGSDLSLAKWGRLLKRWIDAKEIELYEEAAFQGDEERAEAYVFGPGSIRGVLLTYSGGELHVRLGVLSSRKDWALAFNFVRTALKKGGGTFEREDGTVYERSDLNKARAHQESVEDFVAAAGMLGAQFAQHGEDFEASFPTGTFAVPLKHDMFAGFTPDDAPKLEKRLVKKVRQLAEAYHSATMVLTGDVRLATWALIPTIVGKCDAVGVDFQDTTIRLEDLLEVLGDRAERLGDDLVFLPELDREADRRLLKAIAARAVDVEELTAAGGGGAGGGEVTASEPFGELDLEQAAAVADGANLIMENMFAGKDPAVAEKKLVKQGLDPELAEGLVLIVAKFMAEVASEGRDPAEVLDDLVAEGVPPGVVMAATEGIQDAFARYQADRGGKKKKGKGGRSKESAGKPRKKADPGKAPKEKAPKKKGRLSDKAPKKRKRRF